MSFSFRPTGVAGEASASSSAPSRAPEPAKGSFFFIALAALVISVLIALGMYGYSELVRRSVEGKKTALQNYDANLGVLPLEDIRQMSNRLRAINQLVKEHPSALSAFKVVEESVENSVIYSKLDLTYSEQSKQYVLTLNAKAPSYRAVIQQVDALKKAPYTQYLSKISVDGVSPESNGDIRFSIKSPITIKGIRPETVLLKDTSVEGVVVNQVASLTVSTTTTP